jgi:DNA-binding CsgD family transcriptional regulator
VRPSGNATSPAVRLTARQAELLDWILIGKSNREIADLTHLSEGTVKNHVSTLLLLFGVRSRAQLISHLR